MRNSIFLLFFILLFSCSHMRSGQYAYFQERENLEQFVRRQETSLEELKKFNKKEKLKPGKWVFVPTKKKTLWDKAMDTHLFLQKKKAQNLISNESTKNSKEKTVVRSGNLKFAWPIGGKKPYVSSYFGPRRGRFHEGIDIAVPIGTKIMASESGEVIYANNKIGGYGNLVIISHGQDFFSLYAHAKKMLVKKGDKIKRGKVVALVGMTGRTSGPHLHFEVRKGKRAVNPMDLLPKL